ncbi:MAG: hypothetical protein PF484_07290 [Bacteroidales bacterium]|jgi:hypothetical protein|nr:hypothetical protein [Bacteroidales bacterium]
MEETHINKENSTMKSDDEDMDLGVLFNLLRSLFKSIGNGIKTFFATSFNMLISFFIYLKRHIIKFIIAAVIGGILGAIVEYKIEEPLYSSSMTVQANYESIIQLYNDIEYCEGLISEKDYISLGDYFKIDSIDASSIKKIEVSPYTNDNQIILAYNDFISKLDSNVIENIDYEKFSQNIPKEEFLYHVINVESTNRALFEKLEKPIINSLADNPYYSKLLQTEISNLQSQENVLISSMIELDSLRQFYKEISLNESKKENAATTFYMGNTEEDKRDIIVFDKYIKANIDLVEIKSEINLKNEIVNVVSSFNKTGAEVKGLLRNSMVLGFFGGILLIFIYLLVIESNRFLISQERKLKGK